MDEYKKAKKKDYEKDNIDYNRQMVDYENACIKALTYGNPTEAARMRKKLAKKIDEELEGYVFD